MEEAEIKKLSKDLEMFSLSFREIKNEIQKAIVGYDELLEEVLIGILSKGHLLLEGVPGLGKTYLVRVLSKILGLQPGRVQCTPDLMPADILGTHLVNEDAHGRKVFFFEKGPVFRNLLLVDEINRATPKSQAALLEVMQEKAVTAGSERHALPEPFFVIATQNPMEMEGTYPLPEAQLDRFMFKLKVPFPKLDHLVEISVRTSGYEEPELKNVISEQQLQHFQNVLSTLAVSESVAKYAAKLILSTHPESEFSTEEVKQVVSYGGSPRGLQALVRAARVVCGLRGGTAVSRSDIDRVLLPCLRHRVILNFDGETRGISMDTLLERCAAHIRQLDKN